MEKTMALRSLYGRLCCRSYRMASINHQLVPHLFQSTNRGFFNLSSLPKTLASSSECRSSTNMGLVSRRFYSEDVSHLPVIEDPDLKAVFKDLMAASWDSLPETLIHDAKSALSKTTDDKTGNDIVTNVFRAAVAVEEFCDMIMNLKMELDDTIGMSGENVKPLSEEYVKAIHTIFERYTAYLDAFGPDESYLRKKAETELGTKMIYLKMRCSGIGSDWGKVTVLGTSGLSGSYVEHRS